MKHLGAWLQSLKWGSASTRGKKTQQTTQPKNQGHVCQNCAAFSCLLFSLGFQVGPGVVWAEESRLHQSRTCVWSVYSGTAKVVQIVMQIAAMPWPPVSNWAWVSVLRTGLFRFISLRELSKYAWIKNYIPKRDQAYCRRFRISQSLVTTLSKWVPAQFQRPRPLLASRLQAQNQTVHLVTAFCT